GLPSVQLKDTDSAPQTDLETLGGGTTSLQDEEFPAITKKSKKDKKKKKGLASISTPDEAPATPEPELTDQPAFPAANPTPEPPVVSPEALAAEDQSPKAVEEATTAEAAPPTEPRLVPSEVPVVEEQISTPAKEEAATSKKSKKDKKKKESISIDTPEEQLPSVEDETLPESTTVSQTAETLEEPALPAVDETTQPKGTPAEGPTPAPETTQPTEENPIEAEPYQDKPVDAFAGLSKKAKKKKMAEIAAAEAKAAALSPSVETDKALEETIVEERPATENIVVEETSDERAVAEETSAEDKSVDEKPAEREMLQDGSPKDEIQGESTSIAEQLPESPKVEKDPFAGLSKLEKKKKKKAELADAEKAAADANAKAAEEKSVDNHPVEAAVEDETIEEIPAQLKPTEESLVDDKPANKEHVEGVSATETPQTEAGPSGGLGEKEEEEKLTAETAAEDAISEPVFVETTQIAEEKPAETALEDNSVEEKTPDILIEDRPVKENVAEKPDPETPIVEVDPFAGLNRKQKKKKMAEMAKAAAAAEEKEVVDEKPADSQTDNASKQIPALESDPSALIADTSKHDSVPELLEEAPQPADIANPEDELPILEKKSKKDKKKKGQISQSDPVAESVLEQPVEQQPEQQLEPKLQAEVPPSAPPEVQSTPLETAHPETVSSDEAAGLESTPATEQLPAAEATVLGQESDFVQPADTEQELPVVTGKKNKKKKGRSLDLTEAEPSIEPAPEVIVSAAEPIAEPVAEPVVEPVAALPTEASLEPSKSSEDTAWKLSSAMPHTSLEQSADQPGQPETAAQTNVDDVSAPKLSKKDKKKKKKGKLQDDSNPPSGAATPTVLEPSDPLDVPAAAQTIPDTSTATIPSPEPAELSREPLQETPATQDNTIGEVAEETPLATDLLSSKITHQEAAPEPKSPSTTALFFGEDDLPPVDNNTSAKDNIVVEPAFPPIPEESTLIASEPAIPDPEEEYPLTTKKSKKEKQRSKGKSADAVLVEPEESTPPTPDLQPNLADEVVEVKKAPATEAETASLPTETAPIDIFAKTPSEVPAEAAPVEAAAGTPIAAASDAPAEVAASSPNLEYEFPSVQKKSKKDKKKKKKGKSQDDSETASGTATPAEILNPGSQAKQSPDVLVEPAEASQDVESPTVPFGSEPTTSQDHPQAEDRSVEETLVANESPAPLSNPVQEVVNAAVTEHQPPAEGEWSEATPAKISKDNKKNRKSKADDDLDMGSGTATSLEAAAEEAKNVTPTEQASTTDNDVASDLPIIEPSIAATAPEVPAQDFAHEMEKEPELLVHKAVQEQHADEKPDAPTKSEALTLEPEWGVDGPVVMEEPQDFVVKKSKKDKKKRKSTLVEPEATVPAIDERSTPPEDHATQPVQEPSIADPATEISVVESTEDTAAPADEWTEALASIKSKKNKKQSPVVEPE
ncbi:hypothetical protein LX32DRAFT_508066, partial [Colletotrichum zoysiae]